MSEEGSVETVHVKDVGPVEDVVISEAPKGQEECVSETNEVPVPKPPSVNSTRAAGTRAGKPQVKSRYRGDHHVSSIHDHCKHGTHGKRCDQHDDAVKPWKMVRRKSVETAVTVKVETSGLRKKSLASVTKPESSVAAKRNGENKGTKSTLADSAVVKKVPGLGNEKSSSAVKKVSRISVAPKSLKNKEKAKTQTISGEDVKEKTVCVVEASVKGVQSEKQASSEKKSGDAEFEADQTPEKKIRPKRMMSGAKVNLAKQMSFKKGKTLEPRPEDASPKWIKFRKKVVQELKPQTEGKKKKNLKGIETRSGSCEGSKHEKVVLRHQKVEGKKKMMTLFNNVIEETMSKLTKVRKTKVKALIGAFETVISLQDTKTPQKVQSKATTL
ncbi:hypothetical protein HID58_049754 [Brassica napus]|uniref:Calmodulin-binding domain-containing protein n=1 Tax=Brassica napus TaxID=3708 RepID=A0ABQ8B7F0_BRANA|nr:uncharacterized protein LOC106382739 [Brassica napus]XP_048603207.1 uncharacterized protein LOC106382739 [Brassica napus]XP_048603208.1 uncharacterized protein LOC106382739 [Brassica napus]XP_048603209.1 uncharacterized protein LOC106382739 [Brassica napus]XP_048603210.1 uncharacterized protein LOC106382739 [Brassica napus]XP_048603211.1 uncharacterized protein LOC106382739 [Brassica napus]XP_048603212.1 uncharacterized protein LOC106382739 [Brassica napus]KAH0900186.1 hypothetical protei